MTAQNASVPGRVLGRGLSLNFSLLLHLLVIALVLSAVPCAEAKIKLVKKDEWGAAPASPDKSQGGEKGVKIHYEGEKVNNMTHSECAGHMRGIQDFHMKGNGWSDIAYNLAVCQHGYVFEGRGAGYQTAGNGNSKLNRDHFAVVGFIGDEGVTEPTPEMIKGFREAIAYMRKHGDAGKEIKGHKDGYSTSCPGPALYKLVKDGDLEPRQKKKAASKTKTSKKSRCSKTPTPT